MNLFGNGKNKSDKESTFQVQAPRRVTLEDLVPNNEKLLSALQTFLLGDPKRQIPLLGTINSLLLKGEQDKARGEILRARINYETAAKIEIYNRNKEGAEKFLRLADGVAERASPYQAIIETMLTDLDEVMRVSKQYYDSQHISPKT